MRYTMSRFFRYKAFQKLAVSYFLLILVTVTLLSGALFYLFSRSAVNEIDRNSKTVLSQISYASDVIYNQVMTVGNALINDPEIISFLNEQTEDKTSNYHIFGQLNQIKSAYPYIHRIGIYRASTDTSVDTAGLPFDKSLYEIGSEQYMEFYPSEVTVRGMNNNMPFQLLTFLLYPDFSFHSTDNPLIYISIEEQSLLATIRTIGKVETANNVFVINNEGQVLSHTDTSLFLKDWSQEDYIQRILKSGNAEDSFTLKIGHVKHQIAYVKSVDMDWFFVSVTPYNSLISNIHQLRNITMAITLGIVLVGLLASIFLSQNLYKPLLSLFEKLKLRSVPDSTTPIIDEYKILTEVFTTLEEKERSMQHVLHRSTQTVREHYLQALIKGSVGDVSIPEDIIRDIDGQLPGPYFSVIVFKIDQIRRVKSRVNAEQHSLLRFALGNIAKEILGEFGECELIITDENEVVAVCQYPDNELPLHLKEAIRGVQSFLKRYFKLTLSVGIGDLVYGRKNVQHSYTSAQQYVKYRLIYGTEAILDAAVIRSHLLSQISYPVASEKKIIEGVQARHEVAIKAGIDDFIALAASGSCNQFVAYSLQLLLSLLKSFEYLQSMPEHNFNDYLDAVTSIEEAEHLEEIRGVFESYCAEICVLIEQRNNWQQAQKHNKVMEQVQTFIQENYAEPNLSLELVAGFSGLSSSYLGKLFKSSTGQSFSEYLNHTRLERASQLLVSTDATAAKISESVGMYNISYFSTLFKKKYGVSPSVYREQALLREEPPIR
ncbi:helix-turn-helix domain-containing protein [Cohnella fermenti]|uniref:Helix-turn-helix domain-containing protein n=1 Tax=Cohnella fermenti TaxID=2565925 RepID=A0A4S4BVS3_9BACL|nr:helix-turn-helix domain-containing protein [Cohnella fermenti]THF77113.1 helix-turn-helix domain-containing protein [Cohnella fermenti]